MKEAVRTLQKYKMPICPLCPPPQTDRIIESFFSSLPPGWLRTATEMNLWNNNKTGVQNHPCQPVHCACGSQCVSSSLFSNHHMPAAGVLHSLGTRGTHMCTTNPAGKGTGQDRVHPNPGMWKVDREESYFQDKAQGFGGSLVVFFKNYFRFVYLFPTLLSLQWIPD